jgi:hypothetical protein
VLPTGQQISSVLFIQVAIHGLPASAEGVNAVTAKEKHRTAMQVIATSFFIQFTSLPSNMVFDIQASHSRPAYPFLYDIKYYY